MTAQRLALGTIVGAVVFSVLGYVLYGVLFASFFAANMGSATGVEREPFDFVSLVLGQMAWAAILTLILGWASASSLGKAMTVGALTGLLFFLGFDLTLYASTNMQNLTATLVDPLVGAVLFAVAAAAIVSVAPGKAAA